MFHSISTEEVVATIRAAEALADVDWAKPLLFHTAKATNNLRIGLGDRAAGRPITEDQRGLFFELRYAETLPLGRTTADYEANCGAGESMIDFRVHAKPAWLVELVSLRASDAVKAATKTDGAFPSLGLSSPQPDAPLNQQIQSEEAEIIKAQERIGEKAFQGTKPVKFPVPAGDIHMIVVDARGICGVGADKSDLRLIAYGRAGLPDHMVRLASERAQPRRLRCQATNRSMIRPAIEAVRRLAEQENMGLVEGGATGPGRQCPAG